jgi:hypothetical protein
VKTKLNYISVKKEGLNSEDSVITMHTIIYWTLIVYYVASLHLYLPFIIVHDVSQLSAKLPKLSPNPKPNPLCNLYMKSVLQCI